MTNTRLTKKELDAIDYAIHTVMAGELDGVDPTDDEYDEMWRALESARKKVQKRLA